MADRRYTDRQESAHVAVARLVSGILDGTYDSIDDAQIAFEKSRLSECRSYFISAGADNDDIGPAANPLVSPKALPNQRT
jgi:hypothetical protein